MCVNDIQLPPRQSSLVPTSATAQHTCNQGIDHFRKERPSVFLFFSLLRQFCAESVLVLWDSCITVWSLYLPSSLITTVWRESQPLWLPTKSQKPTHYTCTKYTKVQRWLVCHLIQWIIPNFEMWKSSFIVMLLGNKLHILHPWRALRGHAALCRVISNQSEQLSSSWRPLVKCTDNRHFKSSQFILKHEFIFFRFYLDL